MECSDFFYKKTQIMRPIPQNKTTDIVKPYDS